MAEKSSELPAIPQLFAIPDLWFDVIARLLPGAIFVVAVLSALLGDFSAPDAVGFLALMANAYILGFFVCPVSSRVTIWVEHKAEEFNKVEQGFVRNLQHKLGRECRDAMILSKMHGETVFYFQCVWLSLLFIFASRLIPDTAAHLADWMLIAICMISVLFAFEVADRRVKRAKAIPNAAQ